MHSSGVQYQTHWLTVFNADLAGPFGPKVQTYVDFAASGRPLPQVERYMQQNVHPYYANTHTETSGELMQKLLVVYHHIYRHDHHPSFLAS